MIEKIINFIKYIFYNGDIQFSKIENGDYFYSRFPTDMMGCDICILFKKISNNTGKSHYYTVKFDSSKFVTPYSNNISRPFTNVILIMYFIGFLYIINRIFS